MTRVLVLRKRGVIPASDGRAVSALSGTGGGAVVYRWSTSAQGRGREMAQIKQGGVTGVGVDIQSWR